MNENITSKKCVLFLGNGLNYCSEKGSFSARQILQTVLEPINENQPVSFQQFQFKKVLNHLSN